MISRSKFPILCLIAIATMLALSTAADAQKDKETEQRQELEKKTLALLNEIASAGWSLKLPENRVFVMVNAADLLWPVDEKRARNLYWDALNSINSISPAARSSTNENLSRSDREKIFQAYFLNFTLRQQLLRRVARRDSQLALDMLRATRQVPPRQFVPGFLLLPDDRDLEQEIAGEVAEHDPAQALQVARQSLAKGLTLELLKLLYKLNQKDSEKASQFAGDIITKLQTTNIATDLPASIIAIQLLESSRIPDANRPVKLVSVASMKVLNLSDDQRRDLVELLTDATLSVSANSNLLFEISELMPEIDRFFSERRAPLERKLATFNETLSKEQRDQNLQNTLIRRGVPEDIIRNAVTADDNTRLMLYNQAAISAVFRGQTDSFRDFVNKDVSASGERTKILDFLDAEEISATAGRKQLDNLRNLLPKIRRKEERARAMAELALLLKEKGEDQEAGTLLDEAATMIKTDLKDDKRTHALLTLLCVYAIVDPAKAFALAERTVDQANSQISLLMLLDRVIKTGAIKKSEIILDQAGILPLDFLLFKYGKGVAALAKADFNRTKALADRFERNELRLMAQLFIVKCLLQPEASSGMMLINGRN
jgi:hypothetical protein